MASHARPANATVARAGATRSAKNLRSLPKFSDGRRTSALPMMTPEDEDDDDEVEVEEQTCGPTFRYNWWTCRESHALLTEAASAAGVGEDRAAPRP